MKSDIVTIEPEVVQFGRDNTQTIKIINNTSATITNFFFCLYNTEKFTFSPDSFSLAGHQHRLVTITLRLKSVRSVAKEFAYLKSSQINRRITLLINSFQSPQAKSRMDQGIQDVNTFSSRGYNEIQTQAIERIIKQKEAYIELLEKERDAVNRHINFRTEQSAEKVGLAKRETQQQLQMKLILNENEKQSILKENAVLQQKFEEYKKYCEVDLKNYEKVRGEVNSKNNEIAKLHQEIQYLEGQGQQFIKKLQEKEGRIRELEVLNRKTAEQHKKQAQKKIALIEGRLEEQKRSYNETSRNSEDRIRELERKLESSQKFKLRSVQLQQNLKRKEQQIKSLMEAIQSQRNTLRELQGQKKKLIKFEVMNESMGQKNNELTSRLKEMQKINYNLKEQLFVYKNKLVQTDISSDKMNQYLQIALQSCKSQNDALKRTKKQLEKSLDQFMAINRQSHDHNKILSQQVAKYKEEASLLLEIKDNLERRNQQLKQEHHLSIMKLKTENVQLLERLSLGQTQRREERIRLLQDQLVYKQRQVQKYHANEDQNIKLIQSLKEQNAILSDKVKRYKKETKKQLKSINESAISQINRDKEQKKHMTQKIAQLEQVIIGLNCQKTRYDKDRQNELKGGSVEGHLRKERTSSRVIGIKDQRKEIHQSSKAYSQTSNQQNIFSQLGELRQLNNYIRNQQQRFNRILNLDSQEDFDQSSIKTQNRAVFRAIKFFKKLQNKIRQIRGQSQMSNMKEIEFMKGRIKQLQSIKDQKDNNSNVSLNKTRQQFSQLLEYVREQMRNQYKKLNDHIRLLQQKYDLLKKKIYQQYRAKIIDVLSKKEKNSISQLESTLQRFIDSMSNLSHKEAVLHKEVKLKQNARKQNIELKQKVNTLNHMLQTKKGYCTRDPVHVVYNETDTEWQQSLKREAQLLTLSAEYQRIKEQFDILSEQLAQAKNNYSRIERELDQKSSQVLKLKRLQIEIQSNYQNQIQKQSEIIEENKKRIMEFTKTGKQSKRYSHKDKEYNNLKENLQKQKDIIKVLREKERMLQQILQESHQQQEKERKKISQQNRVIQTLRDLKENNRQLRNQNAKLKEKITKIEDDLDKKNIYVKNLKGDIEENRIRVQRKDQLQGDKLKQEIKRLSEEIKRVRDQLQKNKKKREKQISEHKNQVDKLTNQNLINVKSLQSIVRALMDNLRDIFGRLRFFIKKRKGREIGDHNGLFDTSRSVNIDGLKISEAFSTALEIIESSE